MRLTPAEYVILMFNGVRATARAVGRAPSSISKWKKPNSKGVIGEIPTSCHRTILEQAQVQGLDITSTDLIFGREVKYEG